VLGEGEFVDESLATLLTFVDPSVAVLLVMPVEGPVVVEALPTVQAGEGCKVFVHANVVLQGKRRGEYAATLPALVLEQAPTEDR
jgi:hypothetical protein